MKRKPRLLDLFCGAGGCSVGYHRAGFEVVGVDIEKCKDYPFEFYQADAMTFSLNGFDTVHASPPCQAYSSMQHIHKNKTEHPDLVAQTRDRLIASGLPYVMENVVGSPVRPDVVLCGTMFGLKIIRHRVFECSFPLPLLTLSCNHADVYDPWHGPGRTADRFRAAMGINWMTDAGGGRRKGTLGLAIPPAYTEWIGNQLRAHWEQNQAVEHRLTSARAKRQEDNILELAASPDPASNSAENR